ncbi:MAG: hypothetical protein GQ553_01565 [Nitrosomonadaceae bacterium]|nr:hypothetical protein [Nitrosomonadaceae bacterium]
MKDLEPQEKEAITQFVLSQIENGNWGKIDSFFQFNLSGDNGLVNWMTGEKIELPEGVEHVNEDGTKYD